ncbi:TPA: hypothetical protein ACH3X3_000933 [Trebouxia sp. C0006]
MSRQGRHTNARARNHDLLDVANHLSRFVKQQQKRTLDQDVKQQWRLTAAKLSSNSAQVESELLSMLASLAVPEAAAIQSSHTQLLVCRQEWDELQRDVLAKAFQNVQRQRVQPSRPGLDRIKQQHKQIKATLRDLDSACPAAQAELLADWPSALEIPKLESAWPRLHDEVQVLCQQHQTAANDTRQRLQAEGADLHASFVQRLQDCQEDLRVHDLSPYAREHSDWTQQDQELLFQISQQFKADSLAPSKDSMHQYMQAMLPGKSIADIAGHATWCWQKCMLDKRSRSLFCAWDKARQTFLEDARKMLSQSVQRQAASAQTAADKLKCLSLQHELHNELKVLRCEKYVQEAMNAIEADAEQQALTAKQEEEARQLHSRLQHNKQQLALYYKAQEAARAEAQAAATLQAEEEAAQALLQSQLNQERVNFRQTEAATKEQLRAEKAAMLLCEEQQRTARLDRLRAQVQVHVESDPERAMAATAASSAQEASHDPAFAPVNGYTIETLLKDKRFKVLEALRQQSLHNTSYAKQALLAVSPSTIPRRDTLTTSAKD